MLLPPFSLRRLFLFVTLSGLVCLVPAMAARGYLWAVAAAVALFGAIVLLAINALLFLVTRAVTGLFKRPRGATQGSGG